MKKILSIILAISIVLSLSFFIYAVYICNNKVITKEIKIEMPWELGHKYNFLFLENEDTPTYDINGARLSNSWGYLYVYDSVEDICIKVNDEYAINCAFYGENPDVIYLLLENRQQIVRFERGESKIVYEADGKITVIVLNNNSYELLVLDGTQLKKINMDNNTIITYDNDFSIEGVRQEDIYVIPMDNPDEIGWGNENVGKAFLYHTNENYNDMYGSIEDLTSLNQRCKIR